MKIWMMRVVGTLNVIIALVSLLYFGTLLFVGTWRHIAQSHNPAVNWALFCVLSSISTVFVIVLMCLGVSLLRSQDSAIRRTAMFFGIEILYFVFYLLCFWIILPMAGIQVAGQFLGFAPLELQVITAYPVLGLLCLLAANRRKPTPILQNEAQP